MESLDTTVSELESLTHLGDLRVHSSFPLLSQFLQEVSPLEHQEPPNLNPINPIELLERGLPQVSSTEFSVITEDYLRLNGVGDFQGDPLDPSDDALIYAEEGFTFNGRPILPVQRDEQGDPVTDARNRPVLVENAVAVAEDYSRARAPHTQYSNLIPPSIVEELTVEVPSFQQLKDHVLARRQSEETTAISFDPNTHPLNHYWDWERFFPSGGTAENPLWVEVEGNLNIPPYVDLAHTVLVVEQGQINFKGWRHDLTNVGIITNGNLNLSGVDAKDTMILAAGHLNFNGRSQWEGDNLVAGDRVRFNGLTKTLEETDTLNVVAQNRLAFNGYAQLQGRVVSGGRLRFNGLTTVEGVIASQGPLTFNGRATISAAAFQETTPPVLTANLANDTGRKADDGITFDPTIRGQVQDDSELVRFEGYLGENS